MLEMSLFVSLLDRAYVADMQNQLINQGLG